MSEHKDIIQVTIDVPVTCVGEDVGVEEFTDLVGAHLGVALGKALDASRVSFKQPASRNVNIFGLIVNGEVMATAVRRASYLDNMLTEALEEDQRPPLPGCIDLTGFCDGGDAQ